MAHSLINFSLNTFIKISLLDTGQRISEIQKRLSGPGGYDFYQTMQKAVRFHASGDHDKALAVLATPTNAVERKHNQEAYSRFATKFGGSKSIEPLKSKRTLNFPNAGISISIDPLFELTKKETRNCYGLWATQSPPLTQRYGALACYLMRRAYANDPLGNANFFFSDLVGGKTYSEKQVTNNTSLILAADVTSIGTLVKEL
ncbi:hypothetical protein [uncultured Sulfitobacter sp.]|uniref:hypothetical protein n=1 Tax=uncultured Sulfitobacter sp. TaxID=191468 RepID=UPI0026214AA0|nr:hypothetical protein [uncultured Sulfitobacter sp.]